MASFRIQRIGNSQPTYPFTSKPISTLDKLWFSLGAISNPTFRPHENVFKRYRWSPDHNSLMPQSLAIKDEKLPVKGISLLPTIWSRDHQLRTCLYQPALSCHPRDETSKHPSSKWIKSSRFLLQQQLNFKRCSKTTGSFYRSNSAKLLPVITDTLFFMTDNVWCDLTLAPAIVPVRLLL